MEWEIREILLAYVALMRESASEAYDADLMMWAIFTAAGAKVKKPDPPAVLRVPKILIGG